MAEPKPKKKVFGAGGRPGNGAGCPQRIGPVRQRRATGMADSTDRARALNVLRQIWGTQGQGPLVQGHWGADGSRGSIRSWNSGGSARCGDLEASPVPPGGEPTGSTRLRDTLHRGIPRLCLGVGKPFGIKIGLMPPEGPQGFEDFALGVQPRMGSGADLAERSLVKIPDRTGTAFGGLEEGAIGDGLQDAVALAVELFEAQGFVVAGLVADGQAAVAGKLGELFEAGGVLNEGDEEMSADEAHAWDGAEVLDFGEGPAGLEHEAAGLLLSQEGLLQLVIEQLGLGAERLLGQLFQPKGASGLGKDGGAGGEEAPMLEEGFDLELEAGLAADGVVISLGGAFEEDALIAGGLPDGFVFMEAQEAGQGKGVAAVMLVGVGTDEAIAAGIADDHLLDMRAQELGDPAGEVGFLEHEAFVGGGDGLDLLEEGVRLGAKAPPVEFVALIVEVSEHTILGVGIQAQPGYRGIVNHRNLSMLMIDMVCGRRQDTNCSFNESRNSSIRSVVRFSIDQEPTPTAP